MIKKQQVYTPTKNTKAQTCKNNTYTYSSITTPTLNTRIKKHIVNTTNHLEMQTNTTTNPGTITHKQNYTSQH